MTVAQARQQRRRTTQDKQRESSGRSPLALVDVETLDAEPPSDAEWWIVKEPPDDKLEAFTYSIAKSEPASSWSYEAPMSFSGTVSYSGIEPITPAEIVWHIRKKSAGVITVKRVWDAITRRLSGTVFGDEDLFMLRLHEVALLSAAVDGAHLNAKARPPQLESAGTGPKPKLKLASLQKRGRRVRAQSRMAAARATALVSDGEE